MLTEIYFEIDEFYKRMSQYLGLHLLTPAAGKRKVGRPSTLSVSEVAVILVYYHLSAYKNFKRYYVQEVCGDLRREFKSLPPYRHFVTRIPSALPLLMGFLLWRCSLAKRTGIYYIDSSPLKACHPKRAHRHRVMSRLASWGKTSVGWFFGLKYHLIINNLGELVSVTLTTGSVADNHLGVLRTLTRNLQGLIFGDKGYLLNAKKKATLEQHGTVRFITKKRKNMKPSKTETVEQQRWLRKRAVVECVIAAHKEEANIEHTRHRSDANAMVNLFAALIAYSFNERKPSAIIQKIHALQQPSTLKIAA